MSAVYRGVGCDFIKSFLGILGSLNSTKTIIMKVNLPPPSELN